jgi:hypothetical protein
MSRTIPFRSCSVLSDHATGQRSFRDAEPRAGTRRGGAESCV